MSLRKTADKDTPHAIFRSPDGTWEWRVLKTYKAAKNEKNDPYARWFVAVKSPYTFGSFELGDTYAGEVRTHGSLVEATEEWREAYGEKPVEEV